MPSFPRHPDNQTVGRYVVQRLAALGPARHHEPDGQEEQGQKLHEVADRRLTKPYSVALSGDHLQTQNALTNGGAPRLTLGEGRVQPPTHGQDQDESHPRGHLGHEGGNSQQGAKAAEHKIDGERKHQRAANLQGYVDGAGPDTKPESGVGKGSQLGWRGKRWRLGRLRRH